ncbi:hypothetical protein N7541_000426 [Penicillium brevicompactum]|uniref:Uncharacterized protein n=1 Tax=Penicillium brevicompactum TaxID=5074 RepID=A0A9W9RUA0_PENBR|nr:hypothetical protein N7541_000426 [Penicillium brevicompactum]
MPVNAEHVVIQSPCAEITTLAHMLVEAADYFNSHIGPSIKPMLDITPKFGVPVISPIIFQHGLGYPDHTRLVLACTSLGHRMCQNADQWNALNHKFLYCRGLIINSLRDEINTEDKKTSNFLVAGILTLVLVDVRQGMSHTSWRYHLNAIRKIINLRGGFRSFSESPGAIPLLHSFMVFEVLGDTSSPVSDLAVNEDQIDEIYSMMDEYAEEMDLFRIIPAPLFIAIIKINHLRSRAADLSLRDGQTSEAYEILYAILIFLPEDWALSKSKTQESDFTTIAIAYKAAVTLYCISSLQSVAVLPATHYLTNIEISMTRMLKQTLSKALCSAKFMRLLLWPLVVLGALARIYWDIHTPDRDQSSRKVLGFWGEFMG